MEALCFIVHPAKYKGLSLVIAFDRMHLKDMQSMHSHLALRCGLIVCDIWLVFYRLRITCMFSNTYISFLQLSLSVCFWGFLVLMLLTMATLRLNKGD